MYSQLYAPMIRTQQQEIAARTIHPDVRAVAASRGGRVCRGAGKAVALFGVCAVAITGVAVSDASARQSGARQRIHVSAQQLERETRALEAVGFVPTACEVGGTLMTNDRTNQSLLLPW